MFLPYFKSRPVLQVILAIALTTGWLHAAPYGPDGVAISDDTLDESNATLTVAFANPYNAKRGTSAHTLTITAAALVTPCSAAGKKAMMTMPQFTKGDQIPNGRQINF